MRYEVHAKFYFLVRLVCVGLRTRGALVVEQSRQIQVTLLCVLGDGGHGHQMFDQSRHAFPHREVLFL